MIRKNEEIKKKFARGTGIGLRAFIFRMSAFLVFIGGITALFFCEYKIGSPEFSPVFIASLVLAICGWAKVCNCIFDSRERKLLWENLMLCGFCFMASSLVFLLDANIWLAHCWREICAFSLGVLVFYSIKKIVFLFAEKMDAQETEYKNIIIDSVILHEAGHFCASVFNKNKIRPAVCALNFRVSDKSLGQTVYDGETDDEFVMLAALSGQIAEETALGFSRGGASGDRRLWLEAAHSWLEKTKTPPTQTNISRMLYIQRVYLAEFFFNNYSTLIRIAEEIGEKGEISPEDSTKFLSELKVCKYNDVFANILFTLKKKKK